MGSIVDVCNRALSKLGQGRITSLADGNKAANACDHAYPFVRDAVLRMKPWNCAIKRVVLSPLVSTPEFLYTYEYQIPSDSLKILEVDTDYDWVVEGRKIRTDEGTVLNVRYIFREEDPNQYDSLLFELIAARMAYEMAEELTQSNSKVAEAKQNYREVLADAGINDGQEGSASTFKEDSWITVRY